MFIPVRTREGLPSLTLPPAVHIPPAALPERQLRTSSKGSTILFICFFSVRILAAHVDGPKTTFSEQKSDFWSPRRRFSTILGPKTGPDSLLFRCFFENGDFVKIVLPLWWEHSFQGLDLPKIDLEIDCERQRRTTSKKIASDAVSGRMFSVPGSVFGRFWGPPWVAGRPLWADFRPTFVTFS